MELKTKQAPTRQGLSESGAGEIVDPARSSCVSISWSLSSLASGVGLDMLKLKAGEIVEVGEGCVNSTVVAVVEELHRLRGVEAITDVDAWRDSLLVDGLVVRGVSMSKGVISQGVARKTRGETKLVAFGLRLMEEL